MRGEMESRELSDAELEQVSAGKRRRGGDEGVRNVRTGAGGNWGGGFAGGFASGGCGSAPAGGGCAGGSCSVG